MDLYTKIWLINLGLVFWVAWMDRALLDDAIGCSKHGSVVVEVWASLSFVSLPVWFIYFIVTL